MLAVDMLTDYVDSDRVVNDAKTGARTPVSTDSDTPLNGGVSGLHSLNIYPNTDDQIQDLSSMGLNESLDFYNEFKSTVRHILSLYTMRTNQSETGAQDKQENRHVLSGGLQQYFIRRSKKVRPGTEQPRKGAGSDNLTFHDLPDSLQLHLLSFVSAKDLCRIATVCSHWLMLSSDDLLWKRLLLCDVRKWHVIGHTSNPLTYQECQSDWPHKEIYLRCSPEVNRILRQQNSSFNQLSTLLRSFWPKRTPRVAMFGPGLNSDTSALTRKIIQEKTGLFEATGMFPGQFGGVGSGFMMRVPSSGLCFNLMTLYSNTREEREHIQGQQRLYNSRLFVANANQIERGQIDRDVTFELATSIKNLCRTIDALVFVVDAGQDLTMLQSGRAELNAMLREMWSAPEVPVLVLSCVKEYSTKRVPAIDIVKHLQLGRQNRPWQVHDCVVGSLAGLQQAFQWVVEQAQRR